MSFGWDGGRRVKGYAATVLITKKEAPFKALHGCIIRLPDDIIHSSRCRRGGSSIASYPAGPRRGYRPRARLEQYRKARHGSRIGGWCPNNPNGICPLHAH